MDTVMQNGNQYQLEDRPESAKRPNTLNNQTKYKILYPRYATNAPSPRPNKPSSQISGSPMQAKVKRLRRKPTGPISNRAGIILSGAYTFPSSSAISSTDAGFADTRLLGMMAPAINRNKNKERPYGQVQVQINGREVERSHTAKAGYLHQRGSSVSRKRSLIAFAEYIPTRQKAVACRRTRKT